MIKKPAIKKAAFIAVFLAVFVNGCSDGPRQYALSTAHPLATQAGSEILEAGGNAFDAAVAVSAALAVVEPFSSGFGGGGFWLLHDVRNDRNIMLDGRERAPIHAHRDMYLDADGNVIPNSSLNGALAAGIPGMPAALTHLSEKYGTMPLAETLEPAIAYAEDGFPADEKLIQYIQIRKELLKSMPASAEIFLPGGKIPKPGQIIYQKDLGGMMRRLAEHGKDGFYQGETAQRLLTAVREAGGIWTPSDLADYTVVERKPIGFRYRGASISGASLPSSGGIVLAEILNILQHIDLPAIEKNDRTHYLIEAMRRAYFDRATWLGDSDFVEVPQDMLMSTDYAQALAADIDPLKASDNADLLNVKAPIEQMLQESEELQEGEDTTHFSIIDSEGSRVSATLSINYLFGSGFVAKGTGVLLNNEMDDFSIKPGTPNVYGLVGGTANAIEPGKRMLSSMSPTFIEYGDRIAVLGTPGGSRIISMLLLGILNFINGATAEEIVSSKRFHHQYLPDVVQHEKDAVDLAVQTNLYLRGHKLELVDDYGNMHVVIYDRKTKEFDAAADPRGIGQAIIGYAPVQSSNNDHLLNLKL